jgi:uncharacterized membrane-anchored protein YitT (DUF2179 family)
MEETNSEQVTIEQTEPKEHATENKNHDGLLMDNSILLSRSIFKKLSKKYKKDIGRDATEEEMIELIRDDLLTKKQNSIIIRAYFKDRFWKELGLLFLAAFSITIVFDYFVSSTGATGIFPSGVGAIARFLATVTFPDSPSSISSFFFVYQLLLNIPLIIFGIFKLGWKFTISTLIYMMLEIAMDQLLQLIPVINPNDFHFIIDYQFIESLDYSWNFSIWLFVFGVFGGAIMGWSYSLIYRIGGSTGGTDFITVYISKKTSKPVGSINRDVNFVIMGVVLISNTAILDPSRLNHDIVIHQLSSLDWGTEVLRNGQTIQDFLSITDLTDVNKVNALQTLLRDDLSQFNQLADNMPLKTEVLTKLQFIIGPSLFGSIVLIIIAGICTNYFYPKFKLRTFMISTNMPKEIHKKIIESGFQNEIASWDTTNRSRGNYLHRTMFMLSMPVMQWKELERELFAIDPYMKVTVLRTKAVLGLFKFEPVQNLEREEILGKVKSDSTEIEKIKQIAIVKFKSQLDQSNDLRKKLTKDLEAGGDKKRKAEREIKKMQKKRDEMVNQFRQNLTDIKNMGSDSGDSVIVPASVEKPKKEKRIKKSKKEN